MRANTKTIWTLLAAAGGLVLPGIGAGMALAQGGPLAEPFPVDFDLGSVDGVVGFRLDGEREDDHAGHRVAAGDINGDGLGDLIIEAPVADPGGRQLVGSTYVVFGGGGPNPPIRLLGGLGGGDGFRIDGVLRNDFRGDVASAGDLNADGFDDVIIGVGLSNTAYVVFGRADGFAPTLSLGDLDGTNGFRLDGAGSRDFTGVSVARAGDVNGDGVDDVFIGAPSADPGGSSYVVFGRQGGVGFPAMLSLGDLDGTDGFRLEGVEPGSAGWVASAGDLNGDGMDDIVISDSGATVGETLYAGSAFVVYGRPSGTAFPAVLPLSSLDGTNGFRIDGTDEGGRVLLAATAGDLNGDGLHDLAIVGAYTDEIGLSRRAVFVVYGRGAGEPFPAAMPVTSVDGRTGFRVRCDGGHLRPPVSLGDINGDGVADMAVAIPRGYALGRDWAGVVHVVFGRDTAAGGEPFPAAWSVADLDGTNGFRFSGAADFDEAGISVSAAGDVNGDGIDDVIVGAHQADPGGSESAGSSYVVYGRDLSPCPADLDGDGALTIFDFLAFGNLFDLMDPIADFDGDGDFTLFDFLAFQTAFDAGCP